MDLLVGSWNVTCRSLVESSVDAYIYQSRPVGLAVNETDDWKLVKEL